MSEARSQMSEVVEERERETEEPLSVEGSEARRGLAWRGR